VRKETGRRREEEKRKEAGEKEKKESFFFPNFEIYEKNKRYLMKLVKNYFC
jgi:hypothetical protein